MEFELYKNLQPAFYLTEDGNKILESKKTDTGLIAAYKKIEAELIYKPEEKGFSYGITLQNHGETDFAPENFYFNLGVDTYLASYPEWNDKFFPSFLRCEETHMHGYFMSPMGKVLAMSSDAPVASYSLEYNHLGGHDYGHRIIWAAAALLSQKQQPFHHPFGEEVRVLKAGESRRWNFRFELCDSVAEYENLCAQKWKLPVIKAEKYTLTKGEPLAVTVLCGEACQLKLADPAGNPIDPEAAALQEGLYQIEAISEGGKKATGFVFCRKPWEWYLKKARKEALRKPQKASTHTESWYGFFSAFLAAKHYPDEQLDAAADALFHEVMPLMFDFEKVEPTIIPDRIQNTSAFISLLVDRYEADPEKNKESLILASKFGDWFLKNQREDGAYYNQHTHYSCVIYPVKSMTELWLAEKEAAKTDALFAPCAQRHYESVKAAVDDLVRNLEDIGTEGEHTLEDGMISCSCLQIGFFALQLPEAEREPYIKSAEHMLSVHRCLENLATPDCRARGTTIRYWEAQYDVLFIKNLICSPHGWSGWLMYGLYYLYLLTGREDCLRQLMDGVGACAQLMSLEGDLRWAFCVDPYIETDRAYEPTPEDTVEDAYPSLQLDTPACRGQFVPKAVGEQYMDMISGWFRTGKDQPITGGYYSCPLIYPTGNIWADRQGGCCDNDVHEIFKCMEETVLKKAFILEKEDGTLLCYGCRAEFSADEADQRAGREEGKAKTADRILHVQLTEEASTICTNLRAAARISCGDLQTEVKADVQMIKKGLF